MIAGETEYLTTHSYNNFLGKNKAEQTSGTNTKPKKTFGQTLQKVGSTIDKAGGIEGIGRTVDSVRGLFRKKETAPSDFQISMPSTENENEKIAKDQLAKAKTNKLLLTGGLLVGGMILLGGLVLYMRSHKSKLQSV